MNPLSRSRLRNALNWLSTEPNAPKHYIKEGNEINRETIRAALDHLLNPKVTDGMIDAALDSGDIPGETFTVIYNQMIAELTKEDT